MIAPRIPQPMAANMNRSRYENNIPMPVSNNPNNLRAMTITTIDTMIPMIISLVK